MRTAPRWVAQFWNFEELECQKAHETPNEILGVATFKEAFAKYGSDKPDVRFDLEINDATSLFKDTEIKFLKSVIDFGGKLGAVCFKKQNFSHSP